MVADHDVPAPVCAILRGIGHVVDELNARLAPGQSGFDDDDILTCACNGKQAVLTCNFRHFRTLHEQGQRHFGIIECPAQRDPDATAEAVHAAIENVLSQHQSLFMQCVRVSLPIRRRRRRRH